MVGLLEGFSLLVLLLVAMPLKYIFFLPIAVRLAGSIHGFLFVIFVGVLVCASFNRRWPFRTSLSFLGAAVLPFGFLFVDRSLRREIDAAEGNARVPVPRAGSFS
jgi:integral membrane protein